VPDAVLAQQGRSCTPPTRPTTTSRSSTPPPTPSCRRPV